MQTFQSCPINCKNDPDSLSANKEILNSSPESTLHKPNSHSSQNKRDSTHPTSTELCNAATSDTSSTTFQQSFDLSQIKSRFQELNCLLSIQRLWNNCTDCAQSWCSEEAADPEASDKHDISHSNSYYANNILGYTCGQQIGNKEGKSEQFKETPLQKFYRHQQQKKMPAFRGRRGWCGCFKVSKTNYIIN